MADLTHFDSSKNVSFHKVGPERVPLIDKITYGPIRKYKVYNRFPWKMVIHIALLIVVTAQIILVIDSSGSYSRSEQAFFYRMFLNDELGLEDVDFEKVRYFFTIGEVKDFVKKSVEDYFGLEDADTLERYTLPTIVNETTQEEGPAPVNLDVFFRRGHSRQNHQNLTYDIFEDNLGPFAYSDEDFRDFVSNSTHFRLLYRLDNLVPSISLQNFD